MKVSRNLPRTKKLKAGDLVKATPGLLACAPGWHRDDIAIIIRIEETKPADLNVAIVALKGTMRNVHICDIMHIDEIMCQLP